jgi:cardiolipin synthase
VLNIPNALTLLRIVAIPAFLILLVDRRHVEALAVFVGAGITDALDGAIASLTHTKTTLGAYLDPAADKLLLVSAFIALAFMQEVPFWLTVLVLLRDTTLIAGYMLLFLMTQEALEIRPSVTGKLGTFLQLAAVTEVLVTLVRPDLVPAGIELGLFYAAGVVTSVAGLQYMYRGLAWLSRRPPAAPAT